VVVMRQGRGRMVWQKQRQLWLVLHLLGQWGCGQRRGVKVGGGQSQIGARHGSVQQLVV
jgi:hypothetical protein